MQTRNILAIGTSAGGVEALLFLAKSFPASFPAAIVITIHLPSQFRSELDQILDAVGPLPASFAQDGEPVNQGRIYIAPPDRHLLLDRNRFVLGAGPSENNARPAVDAMLRSVASCCGGRAIGVVLTGTLGDGASGLWALALCGGVTVVQDPQDAAHPQMPISAMNRLMPDHVVPLAGMPALLKSLVDQPAVETMPLPERIKLEIDVARGREASMREMDRVGQRSVLTCPDCGGLLWKIEDGNIVRYRCHTGHAYAAEVMNVVLDENVRRALASAHRAHRERNALLENMGARAESAGDHDLAELWRKRATEARDEMSVVEDALQRLGRLKQR
jgi:two-component system chemotaxis response regulator CheB